MSKNNINILQKYIPENACESINDLIVKYGVRFEISRERTTKLGDYTRLLTKQHKITINYNLNKFEFLIVVLHEFGHLLVNEKYKKRTEPHGKEWKQEFALLLQEYSKKEIFPDNIQKAIDLCIYSKPNLTPSLRENLSKIVRNFSTSVLYVEDIPENAIFMLKNNRSFIKLEKVRKRFKCKEVNSNKSYLVHPMAVVKSYMLENEE
jgi:predicted SprT family Zn-dependent metalloprotease